MSAPPNEHSVKPTARQIALVFGSSLALLWGAWSTKTLVELEQRQIVTVRLGTLMEEFVAAEARVQRTPQDAQARIALYLKGVQNVIDELAADGTTVLVAEAVISGSAPDRSAQVKAKLATWMTSHDAR
jgi:hypothetical protein